MTDNWQNLFPLTTQSKSGTSVSWQILRRHGEPLLVMPVRKRLAAVALNLYPAQTAKARLLRCGIRWTLNLGLPLPVSKVVMSIDPHSPFSEFLAREAGSPIFPPLAIYAGNPRAPGRRYILLLFDSQGRPVRAVKAGMTPMARELIERERTFLASIQATLQGVPRISGSYSAEGLAAFGMEYLEGESSGAGDEGMVRSILKAWIQPGESVAVADTRPWKDLEQTGACQPILKRLDRLRGQSVRSVLWHGDFAPWNLKVCRRGGRCVVLDWERGERTGLPGWDWFHYLIQPAILVERQPVTVLWERVESLLNSASFQEYSQISGISGMEKEFLIAYLLHQYEIVKPVEGASVGRQLLAQLANVWLKS